MSQPAATLPSIAVCASVRAGTNMTTIRMEGKRVLVTGGSAGIGRATALAFGALGATVTVSARALPKLQVGSQRE